MTREEEIRNAVDTTFPIPPSEKGRTYEQALMATGFENGVKWADEHPNRWISVEDRLPEQNKKVIVICEKLDTAPFYKISLGHIVDKTICKDNYNGWDIPNVVYWIPMPKLPEEI